MNSKMKTLVLLLLCITLASVVCAAGGHVDMDAEAEVTYYSADSQIGQSGYCFSVEDYGEIYYLDNTGFELLISDDGNTNNSNQVEDYENQLEQEGLESYTVEWNYTDFSFDYESGQTVGNDSDANVITHIYNANGADVLNAEAKS